MVIKKPSILIYVNNPIPSVLKEICAGVEEEGVLYTVEEHAESDVLQLAVQAAKNSMLGSGIGILGDTAIFHIAGLSELKNPFLIRNPSKEECRTIGVNSARVVKRKPLK